jgi:hypothetical protein
MTAIGQNARAAWPPETAPARVLRRFWWVVVWLAAALVALAMAATPRLTPDGPRLERLEWTPAVSTIAPAATSEWREDPVDPIGRAVWVRAEFELTEGQARGGGVTLILQGLFSADVRVNGIAIGPSKGQPGLTPASETPGRIDEALPLSGAVRAGENNLLVLLSAHHVNYRPGDVFHAVYLTFSGAAARRPLEHYGAAIAQSGVLLAVALALLFAGSTRASGMPLLWAGAGAVCLLLAMAGEMLRSFWNYQYPFHVVRMLAIWIAMTGYSAALFFAIGARWSATWPWRATLAALLAIALCAAATNGTDVWSIASIGAFGAVSLWLLLPPTRAGETTALALSGVIVTVLLMAMLRPVLLLDNGIYVLGVLVLLPWVIESLRPAAAAAVAAATPERAVLTCEDGSAPVADIVWIRAAGNYLEIKRADGAVLLLRGGLSRLGPEHAPLARVHRSYAVNLAFADRIVAKTGSRYAVVLRDGSQIPASRREAAALRERLQAGVPDCASLA